MNRDNITYGTLSDRDSQPRAEAVPRRRKRISCCCLLAFCSFFVIATALLFLYWIQSVFGYCPLSNPLCCCTSAPVHPADLSNELYAVGFDLNPGYVTAAITFRNGTTIPVARHDGSDDYITTMKQYSWANSTHPTPPYYSRGASEDAGRQWKRFWRRKRGGPASPEVAAIMAPLAALSWRVNEILGDLRPLKYAVITTPFPSYQGALYNEDLVDAAHFAGFQYIVPFKLPGDAAQWAIGEINTAYDGMELGSCGDYRDNYDVLEVSFTDHALTSYVSPICSGYFYAAVGRANFSLGRDAMGGYGTEEEYWREVARNIRASMEAYGVRGEKLAKVFAHGDQATDPMFQEVLKRTVKEYQSFGEMPPLYVRDPVYAGALGAAQLGMKCMQKRPSNINWCFPELKPRQMGW